MKQPAKLLLVLDRRAQWDGCVHAPFRNAVVAAAWPIQYGLLEGASGWLGQQQPLVNA